MKKNLLINLIAMTLIIAFAFTGLNAQTSENKKVSEVKIQTSAFSFMCKDNIESKIKDLDGVEDAYLNLDDKVITIQFIETKVKTDKFVQVIKDMGYDADILKKDNKDHTRAN